MWVGDHWKKLHEDIVSLLDCKKHKHGFLLNLNSENWMDILNVDCGLVDSVRKRVLGPFLFMESYAKPVFALWGRNSGLLPKEGIIADGKVDREVRKTIHFVDGIAYNTACILTCVVHFLGKCDHIHHVFRNVQRKCYDLSNCFNLDDAVKCMKNDDIYKIIRKHIPESQYSNKMVTAVCAIACVTFTNVYEMSDVEEQPDYLSNPEKTMKDMGNSEYKDGDFVQAIASYTKIIKTRHFNAIIYNNRALAFLKLKKWAEAEVDGHRAIVLNASWCKGYCSFMQALEEQDLVHDAHLAADYGIRRCNGDCTHFNALQDSVFRLLKNCLKCSSSLMENLVGGQKPVKRKIPSKNNLHKGASMHTNGGLDDIPDLISDSESDKEVEKVNSGQQSTTTTTQPTTKSGFPNLETLYEMLTKEWKMGSEAILGNQYHNSLKHFQNSFNIIHSLKQQNYELEAFELVLHKYALAVSLLEIGGVEDLKKSILFFEEIINIHMDVRLPSAYYKWGYALYKMNKFEEALIPLTNGLTIIEKGILFTPYTWPGTNVRIEESQSDTLTKLLQDLIDKCHYPPSPEAVCRFDSCSFTKNIFYSDPDFKGFSRVSCNENCHLEYHPHCWKLLKEKYLKKEKDFLGQICLTPDCQSTISDIEIVDKDGLSKKFEGDSSTTKQKDKQRKSKLEKKLEQKAKKKQKKRDEKNVKQQGSAENEEDEENEDDSAKNSVSTDTNSEAVLVEEKADTCDIQEKALPDPEKENVAPNQAPTKLYEDNSEPLYVLRKENDLNAQTSEAKHPRHKKKAKYRNVMSAEEFCGDHLTDSAYYNEYLSRVNNLKMTKVFAENGDEQWASFCENSQERIPELDRERPFFIPEDLRNNAEVLESILQSCGKLDESESDRKVRENVYSYMEDYLEEQGPTPLDSLALQHEVETFPVQAQQLIAKSNGLVNFLLESFRFAKVKNCICIMKDMAKAYCIPNQGEKYTGAYSLDSVDDFGCVETKNLKSELKNTHGEVKNIEALEKDVYLRKKVGIGTKNSMDKEKQSNSIGSSSQDDNENEDQSLDCTFSSSTFRKLSNTTRNSSPASQFQLQVLVRSLNESQQNVLLVTSLSALIENSCSLDQLQTINKKVKGIELRFPVKLLHKNLQTDKVIIAGEEIDTDVYLKLQTVQEENSCLQERITTAEDGVVRMQNQYLVKIKAVEKERNDLQEQLKGEAIIKAAYEAERDSERKRAQQEAKQFKQDQQNAQNMIEKLTKQVEQLNSVVQKKSKEVENVSSLLTKEKQSTSNLQDTLNCMLESTEESSSRATKSEKAFLEMKEISGLMKVDAAIIKCTDLLNKLDEDRRRYGSSSLLNAALSQPIEDGKKYLQELETLKEGFLKTCKEQKETLSKGGTLSLDVTLPTIPDMPSSVKPLFASKIGDTDMMYPPLFMTAPPPQHVMHPQAMHVPRFPSASGPFLQNMMVRHRLPPPQQPPPSSLTDGRVSASHPVNRMGMKGPPGLDTWALSQFPIDDKSKQHQQQAAVFFYVGSKPDSAEKETEKPVGLKHVEVHAQGAVGPATTGSKLYDNLTPIPLSTYDGLCDISVESEKKEKLLSGPVNGAVTKVPIVPKVQANKMPTVPDKTFTTSPQAKGRQSSYGRLMTKLQAKFPSLSADKVDAYITLFRARRNNKLTGLSIDEIVDGIVSHIESDMQTNVRQKQLPTKVRSMEFRNSIAAPIQPPADVGAVQKQGPVWERSSSKKTNWKPGCDSDSLCSICIEEMSPRSVCKVDCGHSFHSACVKEWLKKDSTCPLCRVYILLPEEFPSLG